jgi:hypothetical protein
LRRFRCNPDRQPSELDEPKREGTFFDSIGQIRPWHSINPPDHVPIGQPCPAQHANCWAREGVRHTWRGSTGVRSLMRVPVIWKHRRVGKAKRAHQTLWIGGHGAQERAFAHPTSRFHSIEIRFNDGPAVRLPHQRVTLEMGRVSTGAPPCPANEIPTI